MKALWPVRSAFLLFIAADAFGNAFMPLLARSLPSGLPLLSGEVAAGLPVSVFWLMVAAAQVTTGLWERGRDHRALFGLAMLLSTAGLLLAASAPDALTLALARGVSGFGYGAVMILTQDHVMRALGPEQRTLASGIYLSDFFAGTILGTLAGSTLAAQTGYGWALAAGGGLSALATLLGRRMRPHREAIPPQRLRPLAMARNRGFMALVLFAALPSRIINGGFVFYLLPLHLSDKGAGQSATGWVVMIYALVLATTTTFWSRLIDRTGRSLLFTALGVALSGAAMLVIPLGEAAGAPPVVAAALAVALLGCAQAIGMSPQVTVLFGICAAEMERFGRTGVLGLFRVCERVGLFLGPMVAAWLIGGPGEAFALHGLAAMAGVATLALVVAFRAFRPATPPVSSTPSFTGASSMDAEPPSAAETNR